MNTETEKTVTFFSEIQIRHLEIKTLYMYANHCIKHMPHDTINYMNIISKRYNTIIENKKYHSEYI